MLEYTIGFLLFCFIWEKFLPARNLPKRYGWAFRALAINAIMLGLVLVAGVTWEVWFYQYRLFHLTEVVGVLPSAGIAYLIATFIFYWWHRIKHHSNFLWRLFHQVHHSPSRIETFTTFYKHPFEVAFSSILSSLLIYCLLGLSIEAAAYYTLVTTTVQIYFHTNITSPRWVGYIIQRPEMHCIHHELGKHKNNYGDLVWWDMMFSTYENPPVFEGKCGFVNGRETKLLAMLGFKDVNNKAK